MAKKGAMKRDPKVSIQPVKTGGEQKISRTPLEKAMERLSPGVYRGAQGGLVTQTGRPIERQPQAPMAQPTQQVMPQGLQPGGLQMPMDGLGNFNPESIGKTPPGWSGGQMNDMMMRYPMPQGMPQMPQPSANQGGQYRLSPGVYGTREQAMRQYEQQLPSLYDQYTGNSVPQKMPRR